jgi:hypothetical protein
VDLLKSALEISNHRNSIMSKRDKNSDQSLSNHAGSAPKLSNQHGSKNISQLSFIEVLDEVRMNILF